MAFALPLHKFRDLDVRLLAGHTVLDIMNYWTPIDGEISEFDDAPEGTRVLVQRALPDSGVLKTLNHIGYHELDEEQRPIGTPDRMTLGAVGDAPDAMGSPARQLAAIAAITAPVTSTRSAGVSSMSKPRRPPLTYTVSQSSTVSSTTVGCADFCPTGLIPPTT